MGGNGDGRDAFGSEFLDKVFGILNLDWQKHVAIDPRYFRPSEVDLLLGDASKARAALRWQPKVTFKQLAKLMTEADWSLARREKLLATSEGDLAHAAAGADRGA